MACTSFKANHLHGRRSNPTLTACNVRPECISFTYLAEKGRRYGVKLFVAPNLKIQKVLSSKTTIRASAETGSGTSAKEIEDHSRLPKVIR